ncbi:cytochrome P450 [Mucilaginibacter sp. PAMB04274]|uniref:cytochrome P450 n=1 Tax=Mucilaginibacter sp. PAMB04274 TaxID=3138568 RepID=UPI0031F682C9
MPKIPKENILSAALGLYNNGFTYVQDTRRKHESDIFQIDLLALKVICFGGEDAAQTFYDTDKFARKGAVPPPVQKTLTGENAIHTKDGEAHHNRKEMFMSLMTEENIKRLTERVQIELYKALHKWEDAESVVLFHEARVILCKAVCAWAGVPLTDEEAPYIARDFTLMVDAFGAVGPRNWRGQRARKRTERWMNGIIKKVRQLKLVPERGSALYLTANHKDVDGNVLDIPMATVELLNILRPTVAIAWYVTFSAHAFTTYPDSRLKFLMNVSDYRECFVHEVRRFYPFAPVMGARVKHEFDWHGYRFPKNSLVLLDMYGTNHDPRLWDSPQEFIPERFNNRQIKPFDFLAQGGGDPHQGHRCPGEWITIEVLKTFMGFLVEKVAFDVPQQDLSYDLSRMPTLPNSGFVMSCVSRKMVSSASAVKA